MYQFLIEIHEEETYDYCWAELHRLTQAGDETLATAHVSGERAKNGSWERHSQIMYLVRDVCSEIAQNWDASLF